MDSSIIKPQFINNPNPRIGLIALSTDFAIEKDFNSILLNLPIDLFVNRLPFYNPLTKDNLVKMIEYFVRPSIMKKNYIMVYFMEL